MRKTIWLAAVATIAAFPLAGYCQQDQTNPSQRSSGSQGATQASSQTSPTQQDSLAEAARRAREQKKETPKQAKVFDNDNIPKQGGVSAVGEEPPAPATDAAAADTNAPADAAKSDKNTPSEEKKWRDRFAKLNHKLEQDQADLDVMQRELGVLDLQYYNDPVKAMQQNLTRTDINEKTVKIAARQKQVDADKQAISDAQDDLRKAGGDPGWGR
jgi:hypothetical protein